MTRRALRLLLLAGGLLGSLTGTLQAGHYSWTTAGPEPGTISQIAVDPQNSDNLYTLAGFFGPYPFKTTDRGQRWSYLEGLGFAQSLLQDPIDSNVLYAPSYQGVVKTINAGRSWFPSSAGLPGPGGSALAIAASSPNILYAITGSSPAQLFRTTDGAASWTLVSASLPASYWGWLAVDPTNALILYAVDSGVQKSIDGGASWAPSDTGLPTGVSFVIVDPRTPSTLYAAMWGAGVYKSANAGLSWTPANAGVDGHFIYDLALDPVDPLRLYAASSGGLDPNDTGGLFVSLDGGTSWTPLDLGFSGRHYASAVAVDPSDPDTLYAGAGTSILRGSLLKSADGGKTWAPAEKGLSGFFSFAVSPHVSLSMTAFAACGPRVHRTDDGGSAWTLVGSIPYSVTSLVADPSNPGILYAGYSGVSGGGVYKSLDDGVIWSPTGLASASVNMLAIAASEPGTLYAATSDGLYKTTDAGGLWTRVLTGFLRVVAVDPADPSIVYAGLDPPQGEIGFLRSSDGGTTWSLPGGIPAVWSPRATDVAIHTSNPFVVYAVVSSHVYRSIDRGLTFSPAEVGLPIGGPTFPLWLASDPSSPQTLYLSVDPSGIVYRTTNGAQSWSQMGAFVPVQTVPNLAVAATGQILYAATISGAFQFERSYLDVPDTHPFWTQIDAFAMNGITSGCGEGNFCPDSAATRAQAAVFLLRSKEGGAYVPPPATGTVFADVPQNAFAAAWIEELYRRGITLGCGGGNYCGSDPVTRAQLAILLLRTKYGSTYMPPPATGLIFVDVPADAFGAAFIEQLFAEGITSGCGGGRFCPDDPASRTEAAVFLVRAFGLS